MTRDAYMEQMLYTVDTLEEAIDGAERLSEQLDFLLKREEETLAVLGKAALEFIGALRRHTDYVIPKLSDMDYFVKQCIKDRRNGQ